MNRNYRPHGWFYNAVSDRTPSLLRAAFLFSYLEMTTLAKLRDKKNGKKHGWDSVDSQVLAAENSAYTSPIIDPMKKPNKPSNSRDSFTSNEDRNAEAQRQKAALPATGGKLTKEERRREVSLQINAEKATEQELKKEHQRLVAIAHEDFMEAQNAGNQWATRSTTLIETWDKIKEIGYYKPKTWEAFLEEEFHYSKVQESRLRAVIKNYNLISEPVRKQLSESFTGETSQRKLPDKIVNALAAAPESEQAEILAEVKAEGKVTAKAITEKIEERKAEDAEFEEDVADINGTKIPQKLITKFRIRESEARWWDESLSPLIKKLNGKLKDFNPIYAKVEKTEVTSLERIRANLIAHLGTPILCPTCKGEAKKCVDCTGEGLISDFDFKNKDGGEKE